MYKEMCEQLLANQNLNMNSIVEKFSEILKISVEKRTKMQLNKFDSKKDDAK